MAISRERAKSTITKIRKQGVKVRLCPDPELPSVPSNPDKTPPTFQWLDADDSLTAEQNDYLEAHRSELSDALFRETIDSHLPDEIKALMRRKPTGCFSRGVPCLLFTEDELKKALPSEVNKDAKKRVKPGHPACGECDLHVVQCELDALAGHRRAKEQREEARMWANAQTNGRYEEDV